MLDVVTLGILVADLVAKPVEELPGKGLLALVPQMELHSGGCAATTGIALSLLGLKTGIIGKVGRDGLGDFLINACASRGMDTSGIRRDRDVNTSATMVMVDTSGERSFIHYIGANGRLSEADIDYDLIGQSKLLHLAGHFLMPGLDGPGAARVLEGARKRGVFTSLDTAWDATGRWMSLLEPCLPHMDLFIPSLEEARQITGQSKPRDVAACLLDRGVGYVVLKMGGAGSYATDGSHEMAMPPFSVPVVDAVGAGDSFAAGYLTGYIRGWDPERRLRLANAVGALCVTAMGATTGLKSFEETVEFMERTPLRPAGQNL